jgi:NADPH:quinone reductase-like Zn-dependent oxidoreductase
VTQIGAGSNGFLVGDRVFGMSAGRFGNITHVPANVCQKAIDDEPFENLASLPSAYCTAFYAIVTVGRLFTPIGQYERFRNRALRLVNRKPQWVPIDQ